jgi:THO complex subunit 1
MASLFERQRADVESRLDAIVRGGEPVTSRALASLQGALGLDDVILDDEGVPRDAPGSDTRALVEHALCRLTQRVMQEEAEGGGEAGPGSTARHDHDADDDDDDAPEHHRPSVESRLDRCLDLALALSESGVAEPGSVFVAAEQVFEASTVEACARVFSWVERARERLSAEALWRRGKLTMLRTCNDLARRLSKGKTSDVVLRGRVSLLLAALYPLSERSALNVSGAYNNDEKRYDVEKRFSPGAGGGDADVLDGTTPKKETRSAIVADVDSAVDAAFYRTFWNLQVFFRDPPGTLGAGPGGWNAFRRSLEAVLAAFETHQLDRSAAAEAEAAAAAAAFAAGGDEPFVRSNSGDPMDADEMVGTDGREKKRGNEERGTKSVRGPGPGPGPFASADSGSAGVTYLTAAPLLRLQLRDAAFRRHFLTQCAVFLNHRDDVARVHETKRNASDESQEPALKPEKKDDEDAAVASERKARAEAERLRRRVFAQLAATPPAGAKFAEALTLALRRERHWTRWKRSENCRAFERAPERLERPSDGVKSAGAPELGTASGSAAFVRVGNPELDRLWNLRDDADTLAEDTNGVAEGGEGKRKLDAFLRRVHEDADPEAQIEEPYKRRNDAAFRWRLTRLMAAEDVAAFVKLASENLEAVAAEALGLPPWPAKPEEPEEPEEPESPRSRRSPRTRRRKRPGRRRRRAAAATATRTTRTTRPEVLRRRNAR